MLRVSATHVASNLHAHIRHLGTQGFHTITEMVCCALLAPTSPHKGKDSSCSTPCECHSLVELSALSPAPWNPVLCAGTKVMGLDGRGLIRVLC